MFRAGRPLIAVLLCSAQLFRAGPADAAAGALGVMWVGPKWRRANGIGKDLVDALVRKGKLRRGDRGSVQRVHDGTAAEEAEEAAPSKPAKPAKPVVPPWCRPGKLAARVELLRQALSAAGTPGLHEYDDLNPHELNKAPQDRGFNALLELNYPGEAFKVDGRVYLARFAPGAAATAADEPAEQPAADAPAGELSREQAVLAALRQTPDGMTAAALYARLGVYGITLDAMVAHGQLMQRGDRYVLAR